MKASDKARSCFERYAAALSEEGRLEGRRILEALLAEFPAEPGEGDARHIIPRVVPVMALALALEKEGMSREEAVQKAGETFLNDLAYPAAAKLQKVFRLPALYRIFPKAAALMVEKSYGASSGFEKKLLAADKKQFRFDVLSCPYYNYCRAQGMPELCDIFCTTDDICYGALGKIHFERKGTIGRGDECCDFNFYID